MSIDDSKEKISKAWKKLTYQTKSPFGIQFNDDGTNNPTPPKIVYKPTEVISDEDWKAMKEHYIREFDGVADDRLLGMIKEHLDSAWGLWEKGSYPNIEKFVGALDAQFKGFADMLKDRNKKSFTDVEAFDDIIDEWGELANQLRWDDSSVDNILMDDVKAIEKEITSYFRQRIEHGLEITDKMREFKGLDEFTAERIPELIAEAEKEKKDKLPDGE